MIKNEWLLRAVNHPEREQIQSDGRIDEAGGKYLRVILLPDAETIHNACFDESHKP